MKADIPPHVSAFLGDTIGSYENLEVLLLTYADARQDWTAEAVAEQLKLPIDIADAALRHLWHSELLEARDGRTPPGSFAYAPLTPGLKLCVSDLVAVYAANPTDVVQLMGALAVERVRNQALRFFAHAFVLKSKKGGDG